MAVETDVVMRLSATGADQAASALNSAASAMEGIGRQHNDLEAKFGHRFQHLGLQLFAGEALRASGVGRETREVVGILSMAITTMGASFGGAVGPLIILISVLASLGGVLEKVKDHHKSDAEALGKLTDAEEKERGSIGESIDKLQTYVNTQGPHAASIQKVLSAKMQLQAFIESVELVNAQKQIVALESTMRAELEEIRQMQRAQEAQKNLTAEKILAIAVAQGATASVAAIIQKYTDFREKIEAVHKSLLDHNVQLKTAQANIELLGAGEHKTIDQLTKDWQELLKTREEAFKKEQEEAQKEADLETARYQHWAELRAKQIKEHEQMYKQFEEHAKSAFNTINQAQSMAFAKMFVEGQSFASATAHIWRDLAEQVIAQIEAMIVKMAILYAMTGGTGATGGVIGKVMGFAEGGSVLVNKPTMFLAGEAGQPEIATFTPLSKLGGGMQSASNLNNPSGDVQIGSVITNVYGVQDPDDIADQVGRKIIERVRGMGELSFTRSA